MRSLSHLIKLPGKILRSAFRKELTEEEQNIIDRKKEEAAFLKLKSADMLQFAHLAIGRLTHMGFMNVEAAGGEGRKRKIHTVQPDMIGVDYSSDFKKKATKYVMTLKIETLPIGVMLTDIVEQKTMTEISPSTGIPMKGELDVNGIRIIGYPAGKKGIQTFVAISTLWDEMPDNSPMLSFPVGIGENGYRYYKDLDDCPHLLIVGGSKQGKSNLINVILCTYLKRLIPNQVKFILFDLKQGMEFTFYKGIPHLLEDPEHNIAGIIESIEQVMPALQGISRIMIERMNLIKAAGFKNINDYNARRSGSNRLYSLVVIFDEYAQIGLEFGAAADKLIANLSNMARAAGIYIIIGSQYPRGDILTTLATINFQVRIAFNMTGPSSEAMIGGWEAKGLSPRGRAIFQDFDKKPEVQTPRINDSTIKAIVKRAITGEPGEQKYQPVDMEEIIEYALNQLDGNLDSRKLFLFFYGKIGKHKLENMLKDAEGKTFSIRGKEYLITEARGSYRKAIAKNIDMPDL
jgi:hypothetical protein